MLLEKLLQRGDQVAIVNGHLVVKAASGRPVPRVWLNDNSDRLLREICLLTGVELFRYKAYTCGLYGRHTTPGITLQYTRLSDGSSVYLIFNADLTWARSSHGHKAGDRLPKGRFRVGPDHAFTKYWQHMGLALPKRLSEFYKHMGNLKAPLITGRLSQNTKLVKSSLKLANIPFETIQACHLRERFCDNTATRLRQHSDKPATSGCDKESAQTHASCGFQTNPSACRNQCELSNQEHTNYVPPPSSLQESKPPELQTNDEWLADYNRPHPLEAISIHSSAMRVLKSTPDKA